MPDRLARLTKPTALLKAHALRERLLDANTNEVPTIVANMAPYRYWIDPLLRDAAAQAEAGKDARKQLHASLALLPVDATQVDYLYRRLLDAEPQEVPVIRDALAPHKESLLDKLWAVVKRRRRARNRNGCVRQRHWRSTTRRAELGQDARCRRQRPRERACRVPGDVDGIVASGEVETDRPVVGRLPKGSVAGTWNDRWRPTFSPTTPPTSRTPWPIC